MKTLKECARFLKWSLSLSAIIGIVVLAGCSSKNTPPKPPVTYSISGTVTLSGSGLAGVTMTLTGTSSGSATTNASYGSYSFSGLTNGSYTITPSLFGFTFSPAFSTTTVPEMLNVTGVNFTAAATSSFRTYTVGNYPLGIAIDAAGNVWVTNSGGTTISEITTSGTGNTCFVGDGPTGIAIDASGNVWAAFKNTADIIREVTTSGGFVRTVTGFNYIAGIAIDASGNVWVVNTCGNSFSSCSAGTISEVTTSGTDKTYDVGDGPYGIAIDAAGNVWVTNSGGTSISEITTSGMGKTYTVGNYPLGIAIDASGNVWVTNGDDNTISEVTTSGTVNTYLVGSGPAGIAIDASGNVWVANDLGDTISEVTTSGTGKTYNAGSEPLAIAIDAFGNVWVTNWGSGTITELVGLTTGPQFFPCSYFTDTSCPQFQGGGNYGISP